MIKSCNVKACASFFKLLEPNVMDHLKQITCCHVENLLHCELLQTNKINNVNNDQGDDKKKPNKI
jgi:hypothetical protein